MHHAKRSAHGFLLLMVGLLWLGMAGGCSTNPATGRSQLLLISEKQEVAMGLSAEPGLIDSYGGPVKDEIVQQYVKGIGQKLARHSWRDNMPWDFHVVDSAVINAFALPGGKIFITRGLMEKFSNEAQLAGVLGHEIGHVSGRHQADQISRAIAVNVGVAAAGIATEEKWVGIIGGVGGNLYLLKYGRDQELESDDFGLKYMTKEGYDPSAMIRVMEILREAGGGSGIEMLRTHPLPDTRIDALKDQINTRYPHTQNNPQYRTFPQRYQEKALSRFKKLPAPKHNPK